MAKVSVLEIDGASVAEIMLEGFSPADIIEQRGEKFEEYRRNPDHMPVDCVVGINITHVGHNQVVVSLFDHDGAAVHYIGPADHFTQVPPLDEEPAYDNYHGV